MRIVLWCLVTPMRNALCGPVHIAREIPSAEASQPMRCPTKPLLDRSVPSTVRLEIVQPVTLTAPSVSGLSTIVSCHWFMTTSQRLPLVVRSSPAAQGSNKISAVPEYLMGGHYSLADAHFFNLSPPSENP